MSILDMVNTTAEITLVGPDGEELFGKDAVKVRLQSLQALPIKQKALEAQALFNSANKTQKTEEFAKLLMGAEKTATDMAALAIVGWSNDEAMGGPYTPEYAKQLLADPRAEFIRKQINEFVGRQENFFVRPASGCSKT